MTNDLITRSKQGDEIACTELYAVLAPRLRRIAYKYLRRDHEDFMQDAAARIFLKLHTFNGKSEFLTWATRVAMNEALTYLRRGRRLTLSTDAEFSIDAPNGDDQEAGYEIPDVEREYAAIEARMDIAKVLPQLRPSYLKVIEAHYFKGMRPTEISEALGIHIGTVKCSLTRGRQACRAMLTGSPATTAMGAQ